MVFYNMPSIPTNVVMSSYANNMTVSIPHNRWYFHHYGSSEFSPVFADNTLVENNITQTICSAAGAVATIIFVIPGLIDSHGHFNGIGQAKLGLELIVPARRAARRRTRG
mgnify:CR=1 FL=1